MCYAALVKTPSLLRPLRVATCLTALLAARSLFAVDWPVTPSANSSDDATVRINQAIASASATPGDRVVLQAGGTYFLISGSIVPVNNTQLISSSTTWIKRKWDGGNGAQTGAMINPNASTHANDVVIDGGNWTNVVGTTLYVGRVINLIGDRWTVKNMDVKSWGKPGSPSIMIAPMGSDIEIFNLNGIGCPHEVGNAGIRVLYGSNISVHDSYIESGDDTFCAFPTEYNTAFGSGIAIDTVIFTNCTGKSWAARFLACGKTQNDLDPATWNDAPVRHITFMDCTGSSVSDKPAVPAIYVVNENFHTNAVVFDVVFDHCTVTPSTVAKTSATVRGIKRVTASAVPDLRAITFDTCTINAATDRCLDFQGEANGTTLSIRNVLVTGCTLNGDTGLTTQVEPFKANYVGTFNGGHFQLLNCTIDRRGTIAGWLVQNSVGFTQSGNILQ